MTDECEAVNILRFPTRTVSKLAGRKYPKKLPMPLRWPDAMGLLAYARHEQETHRKAVGRKAAERDEIALVLGLYLGFRISEIVSINVEDFDWNERTARVNEGKGKMDRVVPIAKAALDILRTWGEKRQSGLFLPGPSGKKWTPRCAYARIRRLGLMCGIPWLHPHSLRHGAALRLLSIGMDVRRIQKFLGHRELSSVMYYLDILPVDLRADTDRM